MQSISQSASAVQRSELAASAPDGRTRSSSEPVTCLATLALSDDLRGHIAEFLNVKDLCAARAASKVWRGIFSSDDIWESRAAAYGSEARPRQYRRWTWWQYFARFVYSTRVVKLRGAASIFNKDYFCTVEEATFTAEGVGVRIYEKGNMSLGTLQDPMDSRMSWEWWKRPDPATPTSAEDGAAAALDQAPGAQADVHAHLIGGAGAGAALAQPPAEVLQGTRMMSRHVPTRCVLEHDDRRRLIIGVLWYPKSVLQLGCSYSFQYGENYGGYSSIPLFRLDPAFCEKHHLTHFGYTQPAGVDLSWVPPSHGGPAPDAAAAAAAQVRNQGAANANVPGAAGAAAAGNPAGMAVGLNAFVPGLPAVWGGGVALHNP